MTQYRRMRRLERLYIGYRIVCESRGPGALLARNCLAARIAALLETRA